MAIIVEDQTGNEMLARAKLVPSVFQGPSLHTPK
jgi:hypothetical protein